MRAGVHGSDDQSSEERGIRVGDGETGRPLFKDVRESGATRVATDCPLAALQITQGTGMEARHPIRILAEAYGMDLE
jgi:Fe-S oxidoreductase